MELIRMEKITKIYPETMALSAVNFTLYEQEIVSLLGENDAGKTTLMRILYGMTPQSSGEIFYRGEPIRFRKPMDAIEKGICMVHQHSMLVPTFAVTENIIAGSEPNKNKFLGMKRAKQQVKDLIPQFHFNIDPDVKVEKLSMEKQQGVEILKVLYRETDVIILDKPTAVLTPSEVDGLFVILKRLRDEEKNIIITTHKLKEARALADRAVTLRDDHLMVDSVNPTDMTAKQLSEMIVGWEIGLQKRHPTKHIGKICVHPGHLTVKEGG